MDKEQAERIAVGIERIGDLIEKQVGITERNNKAIDDLSSRLFDMAAKLITGGVIQ